MTFEPGEAGRRAVAKHGEALALLSDHAYDALLDELACEDPERRTRGLHASPSKHIASKLRAEATNPLSPLERPAVSSTAGLPGVPAPSPAGASGDSVVQGVPGWSPDRHQ